MQTVTLAEAKTQLARLIELSRLVRKFPLNCSKVNAESDPADCDCAQIESQFVARGLASRDDAKLRAAYVASDVVMRRLERMLADAKSGK